MANLICSIEVIESLKDVQGDNPGGPARFSRNIGRSSGNHAEDAIAEQDGDE